MRMRLTGVVFGGKIGLFESRGAIGGSRRVFLIIFGENEPEGEVDTNVFRGFVRDLQRKDVENRILESLHYN